MNIAMNSLLWLFTMVVCSPQDVLHSDWQRAHPAERHGHKRVQHTERGESKWNEQPYRAGWCSGNVRFPIGFPQSLQGNSRAVPRLGHDPFLPRIFLQVHVVYPETRTVPWKKAKSHAFSMTEAQCQTIHDISIESSDRWKIRHVVSLHAN
jgi:hypothetical protein